MKRDNAKPATIAAQGLGWVDEKTRAVAPPLHLSSTYLRDEDNQYRSGRNYARADNPAFDQPVEGLLPFREHRRMMRAPQSRRGDESHEQPEGT